MATMAALSSIAPSSAPRGGHGRESGFMGEEINAHAVVSTSYGESATARRGSARCFTESEQVRGGRVNFTPSGPFFTPDYGRRYARRE